MGTEHILLIITTIAGVLKAYFEMKKARAESLRANEAEGALKLTVDSVERVKKENPEEGKRIAMAIQKRTQELGVDGDYNELVKEITEGRGHISKKFSKTRFREVLREEDLDIKDKYS